MRATHGNELSLLLLVHALERVVLAGQVAAESAEGVDHHLLHLPNNKSKGKVFPYSLPSVGPGADPGVQAVSPQVT